MYLLPLRRPRGERRLKVSLLSPQYIPQIGLEFEEENRDYWKLQSYWKFYIIMFRVKDGISVVGSIIG